MCTIIKLSVYSEEKPAAKGIKDYRKEIFHQLARVYLKSYLHITLKILTKKHT